MKNRLILSLTLLILSQMNAQAATTGCPQITGVYACTDSSGAAYTAEYQIRSNASGERAFHLYRYGIHDLDEGTKRVSNLLFDGMVVNDKAINLAAFFGLGEHKGQAIASCVRNTLQYNIDLLETSQQFSVSRAASGELITLLQSLDLKTAETKKVSAVCKLKEGQATSPAFYAAGDKVDYNRAISFPSSIQAYFPQLAYDGEYLNAIFKSDVSRKVRSSTLCYDSAFWGWSDNWDFGADNVDILAPKEYFFSLCVDLEKMKVFNGSKSGAARSDSIVGSVIQKGGNYEIFLHIEHTLRSGDGTLYLDDKK